MLKWYNPVIGKRSKTILLSEPARHEAVSDLGAENVALRALVESQAETIRTLREKLDWFQRELFGRKSEKRLIVDDPRQGSLLSGDVEMPPVPDLPEETVSYTRRKKKRGNAVNDSGLRFDKSVPVETIEIEAPELEAEPERYEIIGHKESHRLAQRPASYVVLCYRRPVLKERKTAAIITPPAPANVLDNSVADVSLLAGMLVDKFAYHLPLYRQHQRMAEGGVQLARGTLTNLTQRAIDLLRPIYDAQRAHVLQSRILAMDETSLKVGRNGKGSMNQAWVWPIYGDHDEVVFHYAPDRADANVPRFLGDHFTGTLVTDGLDAYARYVANKPDITHVNCWSHARRPFEKAQKVEPDAAAEALRIIGGLYRVEEVIRKRKLSGQKKLNYRAKHSAPIVEAFWTWCDAQCRRDDLSPSNLLTKALKYVQARVEPLQVFLSDPDVPLDTNHLERALRPIPMGRKAWLFCWTELGGEHVAIIQSLLTTCRLHDVRPHEYLVDVLQRVGDQPAKQAIELTPRVWKRRFGDDPLRSDIDR